MRPNFLDFCVLRFFFWWWRPILISDPTAASAVVISLCQWFKHQHGVDLIDQRFKDDPRFKDDFGPKEKKHE